MRLVEPTKEEADENMFEFGQNILKMKAFGVKGKKDKCKIWKAENPFRNRVNWIVIHYDTWVHGLTI